MNQLPRQPQITLRDDVREKLMPELNASRKSLDQYVNDALSSYIAGQDWKRQALARARMSLDAGKGVALDDALARVDAAIAKARA